MSKKNSPIKYTRWMHYAPEDEREQIIYLTAYKKAFISLQFTIAYITALVFLTASFNPYYQMLIIVAYIFLALFVSSYSGASVFVGEQVVFQTKAKKSLDFWKVYMPATGLFFLFIIIITTINLFS